jgi:Zn-dependent peptidase ImmA (M78 family)
LHWIYIIFYHRLYLHPKIAGGNYTQIAEGNYHKLHPELASIGDIIVYNMKNVDLKLAKQKAEEVLAENYIEDFPVPVSAIITNYGLLLQDLDLKNEVAGLIDLHRNVIYTNVDDPAARKAFTSAVGLGRYLLFEADLSKEPDFAVIQRNPLGSKELDERVEAANAFAAYLLAPDDMLEDIREDYSGLLDSRSLASLFGVSEDVMQYRLVNLENCDKDEQ